MKIIKKCIICKKKSNAIIGYCNYCKSQFCLKHRLPEDHKCSKLDELIAKSRNKNSKKLLLEKITIKRVNNKL